MDVDAARARTRGTDPNDVCRKCKKPGHWAKDCPLRYDIRYMGADELEQHLALARDTAELEAREREAEVVSEESDPGFGHTSG